MKAKSEKIIFPNGRGQDLAARLELPPGRPRAYAVFAHCFTCSKDIAAASRVSRRLGSRGFAVLRFDFTGLGGSEGDFANTNFSSNVADLLAAIAHLREHHEAPRLLIGHSLGGAAVLAAAADVPEARAVVTIGAPSDVAHLRHLFQDDLAAIEAQGSARVRIAGREFTIKKEFVDDLDEHRLNARIRAMDQALLILHAPADEVVDVDHARRIYAAANHPKSFLSLDGADHLLSRRVDSDYVGEVVAAWAARYLPALAEEQEDEAVAPEGLVEVTELDGGLAQEVHAGRHVFAADEPRSVGGTDTGPTPYDLLLAALGACTTMTLRMYARRKDWPLQGVSARLRHGKIHARDCERCESDESRVDRIERELVLEGPLSDEQRARLLEIADRCPVHRTLMGAKEIVTRAVEGTHA